MVFVVVIDENDASKMGALLKNYESWARLSRSTWLIEANMRAMELLQFIRANTEVKKANVFAVRRNWAARGLDPRIVSWLKERPYE
jgi:hypothetical protein